MVTLEVVQKLIQENIQLAMGSESGPGQESKTQPMEFAISTDTSDTEEQPLKVKSRKLRRSGDNSPNDNENCRKDKLKAGSREGAQGHSVAKPDWEEFQSRKRKDADKVNGTPNHNKLKRNLKYIACVRPIY